MKNTTHFDGTALIIAGLTALLGMGTAQAQTIYRVVGADGKVTFSDKPPLNPANAKTTDTGASTAGTASPTLPYALRQVSAKYPVMLYSADNCAPCGAGRALLTSRGIPFTEKTVNTTADGEALQRLSGSNSLPFLTIGGQQIKGYADSVWTQFLNAAGYPTSSQLPANYRHPAATPLVSVQKPASAAKAQDAATDRAPTPPALPPVDAASNPAGIQF